jgi:predicted dehydrogenase
MKRELSGGGALVDLGSHVIDLVRYLLGDIEEIFATASTFVKERPIDRGASEKGLVTVDDAMWLQARLVDGAMGTLEVSRFATGSLDDLTLRIEGKKGALRFDLMDGNWLYWFDTSRPSGPLGGEAGWIRLETVSHYPGAVIPTPRSILGWERTHAENQYRFLKSVAEDGEAAPDIRDGVAVQLVMDAAYESAEERTWVRVPTL